MSDSAEVKGIYKARVEFVKDPLRIGRVRIRIPCFHGMPEDKNSLTFDKLPWAYPCIPGIAGEDFGTFIVPPVGSYVWVMFENEDINKPVYLGSSYGNGPEKPKKMNSFDTKDTNIDMGAWNTTVKQCETPKDVFDGAPHGDYPSRGVIFKSPKGHTIIYDDTDGAESFSIIDRIGQEITFSCPISAEDNKGNAKRRKTSRASKKTQLACANASISMRSKDSIVKVTPTTISLSIGNSTITLTASKISIKADSIDWNP